MGLGNYAGAVKDFDEAIALRPDDPTLYLLRARSKFSAELYDNEGSLADANRALRLNDRLDEAYALRGEITMLSATKDAIADFTKAIEIIPTAAQYYSDRGYCRYLLRDFTGAADDQSAAIGIRGDIPSYYERRAAAYEGLSRFADAADDFARVLKLSPYDASKYFKKGSLEEACRKNDAALADYAKAIERSPGDSIYYFARGSLRFRLKDYAGAVRDMTDTIVICTERTALPKKAAPARKPNPSAADTVWHDSRFSAFMLRGKAKYRLSDYAGAARDFSAAVGLEPKAGEAYRERGRVKYHLADFAGAMSDVSEALKLDPNDGLAFYVRGVIRHTQGDREGALKDFSTAGELGVKEAYDMIKKVQSAK